MTLDKDVLPIPGATIIMQSDIEYFEPKATFVLPAYHVSNGHIRVKPPYHVVIVGHGSYNAKLLAKCKAASEASILAHQTARRKSKAIKAFLAVR